MTNPVSFNQERLLVLDKLEPNSSFYNLPSIFKLTGDIDLDALDKSIALIIIRHESLRTNFIEDRDGNFTQVVSELRDFKLQTTYIDYSKKLNSFNNYKLDKQNFTGLISVNQ